MQWKRLAALGLGTKSQAVVLLPLVFTFGCDNIVEDPDRARLYAARLGAEQLGLLAKRFHDVNGVLPIEWEQMVGLQFPDSENRLHRVPVDPWGNRYVLERQGTELLRITSLGKDGLLGGDGYNADHSFEMVLDD